MKAHFDILGVLKKSRFDHAFLCTFNFESDFFENYCLEQLEALEANNGVTVIMDGREMDALIAGEPSSWPKRANLRYYLHSVRPKGRFHPKLFFLASATKGLLIIGSANLTRSGLTRNAEFIQAFSFEAGKDESKLALFISARKFLHDVSKLWPSAELTQRLRELDVDAAWLSKVPKSNCAAELIHSLSEPLLPQVLQGVSGPVEEVQTISPFFDEEPLLLDWLERNVKPKAISIYTVNGAPSLSPSWNNHPLMKSKRAKLLFSNWKDELHSRQLHAKAIAITTKAKTSLIFGSANFTRAALLSTPQNGNVEVVVAVHDIPKSAVNLQKLFDPNDYAKEEKLKPVVRPEPVETPTFSLRLLEARLEEQTFHCVVGSESTTAFEVVLMYKDGATKKFKIDGSGSQRNIQIDENAAERANQGSTVVYVKSPDGHESNRVLLLNLKDIATGDAIRKERRIRESERSADQFAAALLDLLQVPQVDSLMTFLTFCDIQLVGQSRLRGSTREAINLNDLQNGLRHLTQKNLREYSTVHEAVIGFCQRHVARLSRHSRNANLSSGSSCMHIVRSIATLLASQVERILFTLESTKETTAEQWYDDRLMLDQLLTEWLSLLRVVDTEWLPSLRGYYKPKEIRDAIRPDFDRLQVFLSGFANVERRVSTSLKTLRVCLADGKRVSPPLMADNLIHPSSWELWLSDAQKFQASLISAVA